MNVYIVIQSDPFKLTSSIFSNDIWENCWLLISFICGPFKITVSSLTQTICENYIHQTEQNRQPTCNHYDVHTMPAPGWFTLSCYLACTHTDCARPVPRSCAIFTKHQTIAKGTPYTQLTVPAPVRGRNETRTHHIKSVLKDLIFCVAFLWTRKKTRKRERKSRKTPPLIKVNEEYIEL